MGMPAAMAVPSPAVRTLEWEGWGREANAWREADVVSHVTQQLHLPQSDWIVDYGVSARRAKVDGAWAGVAHESCVYERYAWLEQAGLDPCVLDLDRLAIDRVLHASCHQTSTWPCVWVLWREGLMSLHLCPGPRDGCSASAYALHDTEVEVW